MAGNLNFQSYLEELYTLISDARWFPVGQGKCILDRAAALDLLDQAQSALPPELAEAQRLVAGKREFIANAKRESEATLKKAQEQSRQLIDSQEVLLRAQAEARDILADAESRAREMKLQATKFVGETLRGSETVLTDALRQITNSREAFDRAIAAEKPSLPDSDDNEQLTMNN
jgi:hypothetical protein